MSLRDEKLYIDDILEAIYKIEDYIQDIDFEDFSSDQKSIDPVIRNLEIIGEATKNIPEDFKNRYPNVNWKDPKRMRDRLIHAYFGVDLGIVWETIIHAYFGVDLGIVWETIKFRAPELKEQIEKISEDIE